MRKLLVKHFVLDYSIRLFNQTWNAPRASRIIYPVFVATGIQIAINPNYPTPDLMLWISYFITATVLFFGFVYFRIKPAQFTELDNDQKRQYGYFKPDTLSPSEYEEWLNICSEYNKK